MLSLPPIIPPKTLKMYRSGADLARNAENYFNHCDTAEMPYTVSGLAYYLGFHSRQELMEYQENGAFQAAVKRAKLRIQHQLEKWLYTPGRPTVGLIFSLKNNFGWKDQTEVKQSGSVDIRIIALPAKKQEGDKVDLTLDLQEGKTEELAGKRIKQLAKVTKEEAKQSE